MEVKLNQRSLYYTALNIKLQIILNRNRKIKTNDFVEHCCLCLLMLKRGVLSERKIFHLRNEIIIKVKFVKRKSCNKTPQIKRTN